MAGPARRFLPRRVEIEAYGDGGFRFAGMSHRGSLLCLPSGMHAWEVLGATELTVESFEPIIAEAAAISLLLIGTGPDIAAIPTAVQESLRGAGLRFDPMQTGAAARTWNVLLAEDRRVAAALVAVP